MIIQKSIKRTLNHFQSDLRQLLRNRVFLKKTGFAYYNFWQNGEIEDTWFYRFLQRPALQHLNKQKTIGVYSVFGRRRIIKLSHPGLKIFLSGENLRNHPSYFDYGGKDIHLSLGFDHSSEAKRHLRFPLWLIDCFPPDATLETIKDLLYQWEQRRLNVKHRIPGATLIARHDTNGQRSIIGDIASQHLSVIYPGPFRRNVAQELKGYEEKLAYISQYPFNICPENTNAEGYVTEKLFHAMMAGCIPVYWGADNCPEPDIINPKAIVFYDPLRPEKLSKEIQYLSQDENTLASWSDQPYFLQNAASYIYDFYLQLENKIEDLHK